jgi:hypothetical protein
LKFEESSHYKSDAAKQLRSGKEVTERPLPYKKSKPEKETSMNTDDEAQRIMDIARKNTGHPEPEYVTQEPPAKSVQFQDLEVTPKTPKEKAPKKAILERPLAKEFPEAEEKVVNKMLLDGKIEITYGELFAISPGAVDAFKKRTNPKRIPIESTKTVNTGANSEDEEEEFEEEHNSTHPTHYACPL